MGVVQLDLNLDNGGITVTLDPDPTGVLVKAARARGLTGETLDPLTEGRLTGSLRITLTEERARELISDLSALVSE